MVNPDLICPQNRLIAGETKKDFREVPDLMGRTILLAHKMAARNGLQLVSNSDSGIVIWQYPPKGRRIPSGEAIAVMVQNNDREMPVMLDLKGVKLRTAIAALEYQGVNFKVEGTGVVKRQKPAAGAKLKRGSRCYLVARKG